MKSASTPSAPSSKTITFAVTAGISAVVVGGGSASVSLLKSTEIGTAHDGVAATGSVNTPGFGINVGPYVTDGAFQGDVADQRGSTKDINCGYGNFTGTLSWTPSGSFAGGSGGEDRRLHASGLRQVKVGRQWSRAEMYKTSLESRNDAAQSNSTTDRCVPVWRARPDSWRSAGIREHHSVHSSMDSTDHSADTLARKMPSMRYASDAQTSQLLRQTVWDLDNNHWRGMQLLRTGI
jgi:hypothetical protein